MFSFTQRLASASLFVLFVAASAAPLQLSAAPATPAAIPLESFFGNAPFDGAVLSPNARYLAVTISPKDKRKGLYVIDLTDMKGNMVAQFSDTDVDTVKWVNDERIVFDTRDSELGQRDVKEGPGMFAVNRDGKSLRQLVAFGKEFWGVKARTAENLLHPATYLMSQRGAQNSEFIYVTSPQFDEDYEVRYVDLLRLNTLTGTTKKVARPPHVRSWLLDHKGEPRVAIGYLKNQTFVYYRETVDSEWTTISKGDLFGIKDVSFEPLAFGADNTIYVSTNKGVGDKNEVYVYDYKTSKLADTPIISTAGYDFDGSLITNGEKVIGMSFATDARSTMWFDPKMKALQDRVDGLLQSTVNIISMGARAETPWVVVISYSDVQPTIYQLFNTTTGAFQKIGDSRPDIDPALMAKQQQIMLKARDGMDIPALLTLPKGQSKNLPLVVLVHGGPYVRGSLWGWDNETQFLASRGYAVIEPSFRGTTGFGTKHFKAGWKQWGLAMQDDIADSAKWAIEKGIADGNRVCIAGASYGGYATLMGLIKHHELYKCGVNWVGVSDIELLVKGHWSFKSDMSDQWRDYGMPDMIGDIKKDAEQLRATSPLIQASRLKRPLLMAYGGADARVPRYHGDKFYAAVKGTNPDAELIVYPEEGHGWALPKNRYDFYGRMEKFLDKHIGKAQ
ncbi:MAG: alpha/beta fold hydrolase [Pseudomonadota bacterium]